MNDTLKDRYTAHDGTILEIAHHRAQAERKVLLVWPCTGGAFQMYRAPVAAFTERGISVVLFNPPGHGASGGERNYTAAMNYFREYLAACVDPSLEHIFTGHSGGAGAVLAAVPDSVALKRFFLVSPVLDSRESLLFMYRINTIHEFNGLLAALSHDKKTVLEVLATNEWMDPVTWRERGYRDMLDRASGGNGIGTFLEKLFIEGLNAIPFLEKHAAHCRILLATRDNWYSRDDIERFAGRNNIPLILMEKAHDHYFTGAWSGVWEYVLSEILQESEM